MKALLAICLLVSAPLVWAANPPAVVQGSVLEVKDVEIYTYLRLKTKDGETWAAITKAPVKKGAEVTIENAMVMTNFESKTLKKTFPKIVFGTLGGASASSNTRSNATGMGMSMATAHQGIAQAKDAGEVRVPKASGANAKTIEEIVTKAGSLVGKPVLVRGKVVKYNAGIMGKNWIHLRDGTGSAAKESNDILVTTTQQAKLSEVITVKGVVRTNKDFGAGYAYKVLIEDATLQH